MAIETGLALRLVFHQQLRQTEGLLRSMPQSPRAPQLFNRCYRGFPMVRLPGRYEHRRAEAGIVLCRSSGPALPA
ncbi:MAG: hypothetical protein JOY71_14330 [Acetobacteraceae bacterium]|nr:hypothetical protein [Acetobacteraceae bacterium]